MRDCEICGGTAVDALHRQEFLAAGDRRVVHDVVSCRGCGFAFVRRAGDAEELARHYESTRKYVHEGSGGHARGLDDAHRGFAAFVERCLEPLPGLGASVLDVGCAAGDLLARLRESGFRDLTGIEPSSGAREAAARLHGLELSGASVETFRPGRAFDAVLLSNVLEHVEGLPSFVGSVVRHLAPAGTLFVQVPDASRFGVELEEPFQEFSLEHINFFTPASLRRLLADAGLAPREVLAEVVRSGASRGPAITAAFRREPAPPDLGARSDPGPIALYVRRSAEIARRIAESVDRLVVAGEELVVWGAGALTARLLATTRLADARIVAFVDSDSSLHGRVLAGRPISSPEILRGSERTVLVSSIRWAPEIRATLAGTLRHRGRVVGFDEPAVSRG